MNTCAVRWALVALGVTVVGLLIFLWVQDSSQHALVQSSMNKANGLAGTTNEQMQYLFYKAQFAESDRQEVVLFVIGIGTIAATILGAIALLARKETPQTDAKAQGAR